MLFSFSHINRLRIISFWLFLIPLCALIFSLLFHNLILDFNFSSKLTRFNVSLPKTINCTKENLYCVDPYMNLPSKNYETFDDCNTHLVTQYFISNGKIVSSDHDYAFVSGLVSVEVKEFLLLNGAIGGRQMTKNFNDLWNKVQTPENINLSMVYYQQKELDKQCIKNSKLYFLYKIFPKPFYIIENIKNNKSYISSTSSSVNPFVNGEVSISNLVKRFPINYLFKPLLFITSLLMIFYWLTYQKIFWNVTEIKKINKFTVFGVLSGLFLFFHVWFLGTAIDNDIFNKIRRLVLVFFILCEILAQFFLTKRLYLNFHKFNKFISRKILNIKIIFISLIIISSVFIISILSFNNLDSKIDYILEWNYFALLLFFYLLSALMWKKIYKNPIL